MNNFSGSRVLVVGDLHQRLDHAEYWRSQDADRYVFLGDYFDAPDDETEDTIKMAEWVKERIHDPLCTLILGNHDVQYRWSMEDLIYPGFTPDKARAIRNVLEPADWSRMRLACTAGSFLLSHAGFSRIWVKPPTLENILARCKLAEERAAQGIIDPVFGSGELPRRLQQWGGPLAMPWEGFVPIEGINQIVGHTSGEDVRKKASASSTNLCINVANGAVAVAVTGESVEVLRMPL